MKKVITYGTFDLLHQGHLNLLRRAKELGDYLIVGVTNDNFDRDRGKLNVRNNVLERVEAVKATGYADKIIIEDYVGQKIDDIQKFISHVQREFHLRCSGQRLRRRFVQVLLVLVESLNVLFPSLDS